MNNPSSDHICVRSNLQTTDEYSSFDDRYMHGVVYGDGTIKYGQCFNLESSEVIENKYRNPSSFNYERYMRTKHIKYQGTVSSHQVVAKVQGLGIVHQRVHQYLMERTSNLKSFPYVAALALGDNQINTQKKDLYSQVAIAPVFAISGVHVAIIYGGIISVLTKLRIVYPKAKIISLIVLCCFGFCIEVSPSFIRALVMIFCYQQLKMKSWQSILCASLLNIFINPFVILSSGFWLSYICSLGLIKYGQEIINNSKLTKISAIKISYFCYALTLPITFNFNYTINLVAPLFSAFISSIIITIFMPLAILLVFIPSKIIDQLLTAAITILNYLVNIINVFTISCGKVNLLLLLLCSYLIVCLVLGKLKKYKLYMWTILCCLVILFWTDMTIIPTLTIIDCGQGDAAVLELPHHLDIAIDFGPESSEAEVTMMDKYLGIKSFDYGLVSHFHLDHYGGLEAVSKEFDIGKLVTPGMNDVISSEHVVVTNPIITQEVQILPVGDNTDNLNNNGLVAKLTIGNYNLLLPGDIEEEVEEELVTKYCHHLQSDVLKVPHHGSKTSSTDNFLACVDPSIATISSGRGNMYGHPASETVDRYKQQDIETYDTQDSGMIQIKFYPHQIKVKNKILVSD